MNCIKRSLNPCEVIEHQPVVGYQYLVERRVPSFYGLCGFKVERKEFMFSRRSISGIEYMYSRLRREGWKIVGRKPIPDIKELNQ